MAPPFSPHMMNGGGGGLPAATAVTTPAHHASAQRFANKENAAALYTPGAKSNADMVAEVRRRRKREGLERASLFFFPSSRL